MTTLCVTSIFLFFSFSDIKAQIASIISEDGDGLMGVTPLMNAAINNDRDSVEFFAKNEDIKNINQKNIGGATALHIASRNGDVSIIKILIDYGANLDSSDNEKWTPLMRAATSRNPEAVKFLLKSGADFSKMNTEEETVIVVSASSDCMGCLKEILAYDLTKRLSAQDLWDQINKAIKIADRKNNQEIHLLLKDYIAKKIGKTGAVLSLKQKASEQFQTPRIENNDIVTIKSLDEKTNESLAKKVSGEVSDVKIYKLKNSSTNKKPKLVFKPMTDQEDYNLSKVMYRGAPINQSTGLINKDTPEEVRYNFLGKSK